MKKIFCKGSARFKTLKNLLVGFFMIFAYCVATLHRRPASSAAGQDTQNSIFFQDPPIRQRRRRGLEPHLCDTRPVSVDPTLKVCLFKSNFPLRHPKALSNETGGFWAAAAASFRPSRHGVQRNCCNRTFCCSIEDFLNWACSRLIWRKFCCSTVKVRLIFAIPNEAIWSQAK